MAMLTLYPGHLLLASELTIVVKAFQLSCSLNSKTARRNVRKRTQTNVSPLPLRQLRNIPSYMKRCNIFAGTSGCSFIFQNKSAKNKFSFYNVIFKPTNQRNQLDVVELYNDYIHLSRILLYNTDKNILKTLCYQNGQKFILLQVTVHGLLKAKIHIF